MTAPAWTEADHRIAQARRNIQKVLHGRVDDMTQRIYHDTSFFEDTNVIPIRAGLIGQVVHSAQQLLVTHFNDKLSKQLGLASTPTVSPQVFERPGVDKTTEYSRPFFTALQAVRTGKSQEQAIALGQQRLTNLTATDLQMAKVRQARITLRAGGRKTYRRVTTSENPCELCQIAATQIYYTDDLMPIHQGNPGCQCDVEPDDESIEPMSPEQAQEIIDNIPKPQKPETKEAQQLVASKDKWSTDDEQQAELDAVRRQGVDPDELKDYLAIREHGEIGPVLTWAHQNFTGPADLPNPPDVIASASGGERRGPGVPASVYARARAHLDAINARIAQRAS